MNQSPAPIASATRTLKTLSVLARLCLWLVFLAWGLFVLTWGALNGWIVPRIGEWRPDLERWASQAVGTPVRVGDIRADTSEDGGRWLPSLVPSFELRNVQLLDAQGRVALHLPLVRASVSVRSLWHRNFEQVVIDQAVLDVRRTAQGRIEVAGIDIAGPGEGDGAAADWFFALREFVIREGTVRWTDEQRAQPTLALHALDFVVRNTRRTHQFRLDATPPPEWGERMSLRGRLREPLIELGPRAAHLQPWHNWDGELYADFTRVDVARLRAHADLSTWGVDLRAGQGAVRAWAEVADGTVAGVTADLALHNVDAQLGPDLPALAVDDLQGRIAARWSDAGFTASTEDLRLRTREGVEWPGGPLRVQHVAATQGQGASTELSAERLELGALAALASRLPLPPEAHRRLAQLNPVGRVDGFSARWQNKADAAASGDWNPQTYLVRGRASGLSLAGEPSGRLSQSGQFPLPGRPGLSNATVEFDANQNGGKAQIRVAQGTVELPDIFEDPSVPVDSLQADAVWRLKGDRIEAELNNVRLSNADAEGTAQVRWHTSDAAAGTPASRFPGELDLTATLTRADATRVHRYLPLSVNADARRYVREAVRAGRSQQVGFRVQGRLDHVPFDRPGDEGVFRITAPLQKLDFDYVPAYLQHEGEAAWPGLRGIEGELVLDRASLRITQLAGGVANAPGVRLSQGQVHIAHLGHDAVLAVDARAQGPANEVLGFVQHSPLNAMTSEALARTRIGGQAQVGFGLQMPLANTHDTRVQGSVQLAGNDLQITPESPLLARAAGTVAFSDTGFSVKAGQARLYGGDLRFEGGLARDAQGVTRTQFRGQGVASAEGLREAGLGFASRLFQRASGSTAYTAQLGFRAGVPELQVVSNLQGMALNLPAPLGKPAETSLPLSVENTVLTETDGRARTDRLAVQLGSSLAPVLSLHYERDLQGAEPRVLRGVITAGTNSGDTAPLPATGVAAHAQFGQVDVDAWEQALENATGVDAGVAAAPPRAGPVATDPNTALAYLPTTIALRAERVLLGGRSFHRVVLGGSREGTHWRANLDADELNGYVEVRQAGAGTPGHVHARLTRLRLEPSAASDVEQLLQQPTSVPSLDIAVDDLVLAGRHLGKVEVEAVHQSAPLRAAEWRLTKLRLGVPEARFSATGYWALPRGASGGARRTTLDFRLDIDDSGQLLARFGRDGLVRGGKGRLEGQIGWAGSPLSLDYASLDGQIHADIERGQFLKAEAGAGRLLGVLSLQALPRRLALDFRDVFSEGFAFDFVRGDAHMDKGVLTTNNLQMKGVNAAVLMEGSADIARERQDLKVVVVPEINAGTASLIATAINPAIGLGAFLANYLLRQPLQSATTQHFRITGSWADPQVDKIERSSPPVSAAPPDPAPVRQ
ncbi:YhdP family protein [Hydrogenophaga sp. BPS33]|uniref:YhdP family protein n=1 Tax=Hydrogenophaga sp. BPS33 TaxID=2651974 RepID=UPI0013203630|nr:YhdP family protein [Hydrogenophaga sp. BPS33]QHE88605.1 TIGR02099 family protein [Hydrogenophaga sp. BPS33]